MAITTLHYYFPWAMKALVRWSVFCARHRPAAAARHGTERYFEIADAPGLSYEDKLAAYRRARRRATSTPSATASSAPTSLGHLDDVVLRLGRLGPTSTALLVDTVRATYPAHEHEQFVAHFRGLVGLWVRDESSRVAAA